MLDLTLDAPNPSVDFQTTRYIDPDVYHVSRQQRPFLNEALITMAAIIQRHQCEIKDLLKILELGAGTGIATQAIAKNPMVSIDALDINLDSINILKQHLGHKVRAIRADAREYCKDENYDIVVSAFLHDQIHYHHTLKYMANVRRNLKAGGLYIMIGDLLAAFDNETERNESLTAYFSYLVDHALRNGDYTLAQIEINELKAGLDFTSDFKRHPKMLEDEVTSAGFEVVGKQKIGPDNSNCQGGTYIYTFEAV